MKEWITLCST